jgi:hypothetical protein
MPSEQWRAQLSQNKIAGLFLQPGNFLLGAIAGKKTVSTYLQKISAVVDAGSQISIMMSMSLRMHVSKIFCAPRFGAIRKGQ